MDNKSVILKKTGTISNIKIIYLSPPYHNLFSMKCSRKENVPSPPSQRDLQNIMLTQLNESTDPALQTCIYNSSHTNHKIIIPVLLNEISVKNTVLVWQKWVCKLEISPSLLYVSLYIHINMTLITSSIVNRSKKKHTLMHTITKLHTQIPWTSIFKYIHTYKGEAHYPLLILQVMWLKMTCGVH